MKIKLEYFGADLEEMADGLHALAIDLPLGRTATSLCNGTGSAFMMGARLATWCASIVPANNTVYGLLIRR